MEKNKKQTKGEIFLNDCNINTPVKVCYVINQSTKERLSAITVKNPVLTASMMADLAINRLLDGLESGELELIFKLNKTS